MGPGSYVFSMKDVTEEKDKFSYFKGVTEFTPKPDED